MSDTKLYGYDEIPYFSNPSYLTQPGHLAALAAYFNLQAPPVDDCRILELACGNGINLISIAQMVPNSSLTGIDMSEASIEEGQQIINALGMKNIVLHHMNIVDIPEDLGQFDYIIISGAYSWVSKEVQHKILEISRRHLAENGLLYVHYLVYPAAYLERMSCDILRYHIRNIVDPHECISRARSYLGKFLEIAPEKNTLMSDVLKEYLTEKNDDNDGDLYHQHLVAQSTPLYFSEFIDQADQHSLQYVADADLFKLQPGIFPSTAPRQYQSLDIDYIEMEQLADLLHMNIKRDGILCHEHVTLNRSPCSKFIHQLYVASLVKPVSPNADFYNSLAVTFKTVVGKQITISDPVHKLALMILSNHWPQAISFDVLLADIRDTLQRNNKNIIESLELSDCLMYSYIRGDAYLHQRALLLTNNVSDRPVASPLARYIAAHQNQFKRMREYEGATASVSNLQCYSIRMEKLSALLLGYLDGNHDHAALTDIMEKLLIQENSLELVNSEIAYQKLMHLLKVFAKQALLIA